MLTQAHTKYLVILGFLLAGALAAGVWVIDFGFLTRPAIEPPRATGAPEDVKPAETKPWYTPEPWGPLAAALEEIREPIIEATPADAIVEVDTPPPPPKVEPRLPPLDWKYKGYIVVNDARRALVELADGAELFLPVNATLPDESNAAGSIRIAEIHEDRLVVDRGVKDPEVIERFDPRASDQRLSEARPGGPDSGRLDPRNQRERF